MVNPFYKKVKKQIALRGKIPNATRSSKKYDDTNTMEEEKQSDKYGTSKSKDPLSHTNRGAIAEVDETTLQRVIIWVFK
jgi:hypothetical protein